MCLQFHVPVEFLKSRNPHRRNMGVFRHVFRVKRVEAVDASENHLSVAGPATCAGIELIALKAVISAVIFKHPISRIEPGQSPVRADPDISEVILRYAVYHIIWEAVSFCVPCEGFRVSVKFVQTSACSDPQVFRAVFIDVPDFVVAQAFRVFGIVEIPLKIPGFADKPVQPLVRPGPQGSGTVLINGSDAVVTQAPWILLIMGKVGKYPCFSIKQIQTAFPCPDPQIFLTIFPYVRYPVVTQATRVLLIVLVSDNCLIFRVKPVQAGHGAEPQDSVAVLMNRQDDVRTQARRIFGIMPVMGKCFLIRVKEIHSSPECGDPDHPCAAFANKDNIVGTQTFRVLGIMGVVGKLSLPVCDLVHPTAKSSDPQYPGSVVINRHQIIDAQTFGILSLMRISCESPVSWVEYVQASSTRGKPQHTAFILTNAHDSVAACIPGILGISQVAGECLPVPVKAVHAPNRSDPECS